MINFDGNILIIGFGTIGQALLPIILQNIDCDLRKITVLEDEDHQDIFDKNFGNSGAAYIRMTMDEENVHEALDGFCGPNGFVANMSTTVHSPTVIEWCRKNNSLYVDTGNGFWKDKWGNEEDIDLEERTQYSVQEELRKGYSNLPGPTAIVCHGANPGIISQFVKKGLIDLVDELGIEYTKPTTKEEWASLMQKSGTKVIHCSERDTQVSYIPKQVDEFVCTWSVWGMHYECKTLSEMGWGTHETWMPEKMRKHEDPNAYATYMDQAGCRTLVRSWVPSGGEIQGFALQHRETVSIPDYFTVWENGVPVYRPTVHYAYMPCNDSLASVFECIGADLKRQTHKRILNNDIVSGIDELGALLMGHPLNSWWCGSQLSIEETRTIISDQSATTLQVIAGVISAMLWAIKNPMMGLREADQLPYEKILEYANPYLGPVYSGASDWTPLKNRTPLYPNEAKDEENLWSFKNFYID
jgi:homospermidine synthase